MNALKHFFAICLILCSSYHTYGQSCNFDVDEKDKFTGDVSRKVSLRLGSITSHWYLMLEQRGSGDYVGLKYITNNAIRDNVNKGDKFYLKLKDDKVVTVTADKDYAPSFYAANGGVQTTYIVYGEVDKDALATLSHSPLTDIKLTIGGKDLTLSDLSSKHGEKVMEYAACLATPVK